MAYNKRYNPDALPAFAEPEQAANMLAQTSISSQSRTSSRPDAAYASKPPPPPPVSTFRDDRHGSPSQGGYSSPSQGNYSSPTQSNYNGYGRDKRGTGSRNNSHEGSNSRYEPRGGGYDSRGGDGRGSGYDSRNDSYDSNRGGRGGPPPAQKPPSNQPTPPSDGGDRDSLWPIFRSVDKDRTGQLSEKELGSALVNGDYTKFDPHTVKMMIRMFDVDRNGTISFNEFCGLWGFLASWRKLFDRFDADRSGNISYDEFSDALIAFGYRLSPEYITLLFNTYDTRQRGVLSFDLFVQACISLKRMTDVFKRYDTDRDGYITLSFEQFLTEALKQR